MKGVGVEVVKLVIAVIIFILILMLLFPAFKKVWALITEKLFGRAEETPFEKAILCAYYRCVEGCVSDEADKYCADFWEDACNKPEAAGFYEGSEEKICGWNAQQFPVEISSKVFSPDEKYSKKMGEISFTCVTPLDTPELKDTWNDIAKGTIAGTMVGMACVGAAMVFLPVALVSCPVAIGIAWLWNQADYDHLRLAPEFIGTRVTESCNLPPDQVYSESLKEFTIKPFTTDINPEGIVYIFADREIGGLSKREVTNPGDRKVVNVLSIPTYLILPQNEEKEVQLVRDNWNRIHFKEIGDIFVKPNISYSTGPGASFEYFAGVDIRCPDGTLEELPDTEKCKIGDWFCSDQFYIRCIDLKNFDKLIFALSYGITPPGVELFKHPNFEDSRIKVIRDTKDLGALNNEVSSVKLPDGWEVVLYEEKDFKGKNITIVGNSSYLVHCNWWELGCPAYVSSIKFDKSGCSATIYSEEEYKGESKTINSNVENLADISGPCKFWLGVSGNWNNCIKSIVVSSGCKATLYEASDFRGRNVTVSGSSSALTFDDRAQSVVIIKSPFKGPTI